MTNYTSAWFRGKLFETTLEKYKAHWYKFGRREACDIDVWLFSEQYSLADQQWIHDLGDEYEDDLYPAFGDEYDKEFCDFIQIEIDRYINNGELETYIYNQMRDYANDLRIS